MILHEPVIQHLEKSLKVNSLHILKNHHTVTDGPRDDFPRFLRLPSKQLGVYPEHDFARLYVDVLVL
jgi:hypothetical protein